MHFNTIFTIAAMVLGAAAAPSPDVVAREVSSITYVVVV